MNSQPSTTNPQPGKVACPVPDCAGVRPPAKVHLVPKAELEAHRGVCARCHERALRRYRADQSRSHDTEHHQEFVSIARGGSEVAYVDDHPEAIATPSFASIPGEDEDDVDFRIENGEFQATGLNSLTVRTIARFCARLFEINERNKEKFFETTHAFAFAAHVHPEQYLSGDEIVHKHFKNPKTKQAFFKQVNRYRDILGLPRIAGAKSNEARKTYRARMKQSHQQRRGGSAAGHSTATQCIVAGDDCSRAAISFVDRFSAAFKRTKEL